MTSKLIKHKCKHINIKRKYNSQSIPLTITCKIHNDFDSTKTVMFPWCITLYVEYIDVMDAVDTCQVYPPGGGTFV